MIDDDGYDGIRSHGVDPDWNPFSTPRDDDPDDIGWDDGSETPHANPSRMSRKGVAVLTACTLVIAVAGIGMVITESRLSVRHDQLVSECSDAVASMNRNRERLEGLVAVDLNIDGSVLDGKRAGRYESLRTIRRAPSIQCDATLRNRQLESNTAKARKQASAYVEQSKRVAAFRKEYDKTRSEKSRRDDMTRLSSDLRAARTCSTGRPAWNCPSRTCGQARGHGRTGGTVRRGRRCGPSTRVGLGGHVEDLMNQVRENAGL